MNSLDTLKAILKNLDDVFLRKPIEELNENDLLISDLGIDSLTRVSIVFELQEEYGIAIDEASATKWERVKDILDALKK